MKLLPRHFFLLHLPGSSSHKYLDRPNPQKAVGLDNLSLYPLFVCPEKIEHCLWARILRAWNCKIPHQWLEAERFLLPNGASTE